jgi:hypothetical protein
MGQGLGGPGRRQQAHPWVHPAWRMAAWAHGAAPSCRALPRLPPCRGMHGLMRHPVPRAGWVFQGVSRTFFTPCTAQAPDQNHPARHWRAPLLVPGASHSSGMVSRTAPHAKSERPPGWRVTRRACAFRPMRPCTPLHAAPGMSRTSKALIQVCHGWARSRSREFGVCVAYTRSELLAV